MNSDILIIGGGVIGLSIARELHNKGVRRISIVDRGAAGHEASWAAAGMLAPNIETDTREDFHRFGIESLESYPNFAAGLLEETGVDIELDQSGTLCLAFDEAEAADLEKIYRRQKRRNVPVEHLSGDEARNIEPGVSPDAVAALFYPRDWQVENRKLLVALRKFVDLNEIEVVERCEVSALVTDGSRVIGARTAGGDLLAGTTILATGAWTSLIKIADVVLPVSVRPIRGQMISFGTGVRTIRRVIYSPRGYVVPRADGRVLVGATVEDVGFDKGTTADCIESLRNAGVEIAPALGTRDVAEQWAGLRPFATDGLPVLGDIPGYENAFIATAHYRNGILLAPRTAQVISDRILNIKTSRFLELYGISRFLSAANASANT
jgi:glycine oxidase